MPFGCRLEAFWIPRASLGVLLGSFGGALSDLFGSSDVPRAAVGCLGGPLGRQGAPRSSLGASGLISGIFREIPGALLASFWLFFACFFGYFLGSVF